MKDDIEILDFDDDDSTKKKRKSKKKTKQKRKYGLGEKIFLIVSILFIIGCFIFYGYRTYHYYHLTHDVVKNITLKEKLTALTNIAYQNDGLYEKSGYFYYKGEEVNNYVYYSGRLFRIIDINKGIRMVEENTETNLVWSVNTNYNNSYVRTWLNDYLKSLKDYDLYLEKAEWCTEVVELDNYSCSTIVSDYVGLLSIYDYLQAGGKSSYLNNGTYFWTLNKDKEGNVFYVNNEGSINNISKKDDNYFSYGIRPVIKLKEDLNIVSGEGTKEDPIIIDYLGNALLKDNSVGSYVEYNDELFRILSIDDNGTSLIYDGTLEVEKKYSEISKYLNSEYIKKFNKDDLVKIDYYTNEYSFNNKYKLANDKKKSEYVTIPNIGDMFLNEYNGYWLNDYSDSKLGLYYILDDNNMLFADLSDSKHDIRPIIKLNSEIVIIEGTGTRDNPLIVSKEGDKDVEKN